jgi:membrane peptidoglycan carboxypeptidase
MRRHAGTGAPRRPAARVRNAPRRGWLVRAVALLVAVSVLSGGVLLAYASRLPDPAGLPARVHAQLAAHGGRYVALAGVPLALRQAIVAVEDDSFYHNAGISFEALARAAVDNLRQGRLAEGGSTISQQLAKIVYLDGSDRSAQRKLADMLLAIKMNHRLGKDQILELYLNAIYYGHGAYGLAQAARVYFHAPAGSLDLAQCALLAGLPQAPSLLDPLRYPDAARARRAVVLDQMAAQGMITPAQARDAADERLLP